MKIKWIGSLRKVKGLGVVTKDDIRDVDTITGKNLIRQGLAVEYKIKKKRREVN